MPGLSEYLAAFQDEAQDRPAPRYDSRTRAFSYRGVYAPRDEAAPMSSAYGRWLEQQERVSKASAIEEQNPRAIAEAEKKKETGHKRKGFGKLLGIPELPGIRHALEYAGRLGQANLVAGKAVREKLHGQTLAVEDQYGNKVTLKPGETLASKGKALYDPGTGEPLNQEVKAPRASQNPLALLSSANRGYGRGLTGGEKTSVMESTGGKFAGFTLPKAGGGRVLTEIVGGIASDPLSYLGAGKAATSFKSVKGAARATEGAEVASRLGQVGLRNLDEGARAGILQELERNAALNPGRFARGTAAERAAKTFGRAEKYGAEGLHVNIPLVPGASGQFSLGGTKFSQAAKGIDEAAGVSRAIQGVKGSKVATGLRSAVNPRARVAAALGDEAATTLRDAERRSGAFRMKSAEDADAVTREILKGRSFSKADMKYVQQALDEGTDVAQMAQRRPELAPLITHLHGLVQEGDQMLLDLGVNAEHLRTPGNYFPRTLTREGRAALEDMRPDQLQRLFGAKDVDQIRRDIEKGTVLHRRSIQGNLDQAEAVARQISGKEVKFFEDDPVKAILAHYKDIAGAHSQRQMLRSLTEGGVIRSVKKGNIDAGDLGGHYEGPQAIADYLNRRATPAYTDPALQEAATLRGKAEGAWKAAALNWPGTAARDIFGNAWQQMIHGVGVRNRRAAGGAQGAIDFARRNPQALQLEEAAPELGQLGLGIEAPTQAATRVNPNTPEGALARFREMSQPAPAQVAEAGRPFQPVLPGASGRAGGIPVRAGQFPEARNAEISQLLDRFREMNAPRPAVTDEGLDALKGLSGGLSPGSSRVDDTLRAIAEERIKVKGVRPEDARLALLAREQGANLPGFTKSMRGAEGVQRTRSGRAAAEAPTALRKLIGSERYEERARISLFQKLVSEGMNPNDAARRVEDVFFNYADVSEPVRKFRGLSPFAGFQVKNVQRTVRDLGEGAGRVTYPAQVETGAMRAQEESGKPSLFARMAQGQVPIPGTDVYASVPITSDQALEQLYLAPRIAAVLSGAKADKSLARDLTKQIGGPLPGLGKAIIEEQMGRSLFSGGKIKPGVMNNPFVQNLIPQAGRVSSLGPAVEGKQTPEEAILRQLGGIPVSRGSDPRLQQAEVYRAEESSPVNQIVDRLYDKRDVLQREGQNDQVAALDAVIEWLKADPTYVDTSVAPASQNPEDLSISAILRRLKPKNFYDRQVDEIQARYRPPEALRS